jgi:hypothetical protein
MSAGIGNIIAEEMTSPPYLDFPLTFHFHFHSVG